MVMQMLSWYARKSLPEPVHVLLRLLHDILIQNTTEDAVSIFLVLLSGLCCIIAARRQVP